MALSIGSRIGPFEITGALGVGGMGEVYRAVDANLSRSVAIKVLPAMELVEGPTLVDRIASARQR